MSKGKSEKNGDKKNGLAELVLEKLEKEGIDLESIGRFNSDLERLIELNSEIEKLMIERREVSMRVSDFLDKLTDMQKQLLTLLGLIDIEKIKSVREFTVKVGERKRSGVKRGNGLRGKTIVFEGKEYRNANYFMQKYEITGGLEGLRQWAESNGFSVRIEDDTVFIE